MCSVRHLRVIFLVNEGTLYKEKNNPKMDLICEKYPGTGEPESQPPRQQGISGPSHAVLVMGIPHLSLLKP